MKLRLVNIALIRLCLTVNLIDKEQNAMKYPVLEVFALLLRRKLNAYTGIHFDKEKGLKTADHNDLGISLLL